MRNKIYVLVVVLAMSTRAESAELKSSVGFGIQYGGVIGWQGSVRAGNSNFRVALGVVGLSAGYDYFVNDRASLGVQGFIVGLGGGVSINGNYYFAPPDVAGWMFGFDVSSVSTAYLGSTGKSSRSVLVSFGYRF